MNMQQVVNSINESNKRTRAKYHLTLGAFIEQLEAMWADSVVPVTNPHSYRGYYTDLAFEPGESTVSALLEQSKEVLNTCLTGYKGGEFMMGPDTPLWVADYGDTGPALMGISEKDGVVRLETVDVDEA